MITVVICVDVYLKIIMLRFPMDLSFFYVSKIMQLIHPRLCPI